MWWNKDSKLAEVVLIFVAFALLFGGIIYFQMSEGLGKIIALMFLLFCGIISGIIFAFTFGRMFGQLAGDAIYLKREKLERAPERLDRMKGLVEGGRYGEAAAELRLVLIRDFMDIEARMLLIRVYRETLQDETGAIDICREYFDHPGHISNRDSVEMLLFLSDMLPPEEAGRYLKHELKRGKYSNYDRGILRNRLEAIGA